MINFPNCEGFHLFYKVTIFFATEPDLQMGMVMGITDGNDDGL